MKLYINLLYQIESKDIKCCVIAGLSVPANYHNKFIDYLYGSFGQYSKLTVNSMIGSFKPKEREQWRSICIVENINEAFYHFLKHDGCFIDVRNIDGKRYFQVFIKSTTTKDETEMLLYNQILELEAI